MKIERIAITCCLICGLGIVITLVHMIGQWHEDWILSQRTVKTTQLSSPDEKEAAIIASIPNANLFGKYFSKIGEVPFSNLQLKVTGIVNINPGQADAISKVYISTGGQPAKVYQTGDVMPDGITVYEITPNTVMLEREGRLEKLVLPREQLQFKAKVQEETP